MYSFIKNIEKCSAAEVRQLLSDIHIEDYPAYSGVLCADCRKVIQTLGQKLNREYENHIKEENRLLKMMQFEMGLMNQGIKYIAGIDEVGRGPLAGPVVAAAVILPPDFHCKGINDSKQLSEKKREELYEIIVSEAITFGFGFVENIIIDEINILNATKQAMKLAVENLSITPEHLLIDAVRLDTLKIKQSSIIKGDERSISIAAASIIAKVTRDRLMAEYDKEYPHYGFSKNKGYGTAAHYEGINAYGICPIHRKSFLRG